MTYLHQLTLAVWLPIALSMSLKWSRASSLQFSGLGQAGTHRHVRNSRKKLPFYIFCIGPRNPMDLGTLPVQLINIAESKPIIITILL